MRALLAALLVSLLHMPVAAQIGSVSEPLTIGTSYLVDTHGAARRINVALPAGYEASGDSYPLVFMIDGGLGQDFHLALGLERWNQLWGRSQPAILVGIETVDRQRELLPPTEAAEEMESYPTAGESDSFRTWLVDAILPMLKEAYRHDNRAFLIGESAAGHFVVETWVNHSTLFDGYAAISPSLQWNDQALSRSFAAMSPRQRPPLFISLANEGGATERGIERLVAAAVSPICFADKRDTLVHANALHGLLPQALQFLLPTEADWLQEFGLILECANEEAHTE